jgi:hypothetical protein
VILSSPSPYPLPAGERANFLKLIINFLPLDGGRCEKIGIRPLTLPLSPDSGGEGGVRGDSHGAFYATFRLTLDP